jgi:hypothetical protein
MPDTPNAEEVTPPESYRWSPSFFELEEGGGAVVVEEDGPPGDGGGPDDVSIPSVEMEIEGLSTDTLTDEDLRALEDSVATVLLSEGFEISDVQITDE